MFWLADSVLNPSESADADPPPFDKGGKDSVIPNACEESFKSLFIHGDSLTLTPLPERLIPSDIFEEIPFEYR